MTEDFTISVLPVAVPQQVFSEERVSLAESASIELREEGADVAVGETEVKEVLRETQVVFVPQAERQIEDDWFVLLDVPPREPSFVPPGIESSSPYRLLLIICGGSALQYFSLCLTSVAMAEFTQVYPEDSISTVAETIALASRSEVVVEEMREDAKLPEQITLEQRTFQSVRDRDDDWFLLLDVVPKETADIPPGTHSLQYILFSHISHQQRTGIRLLDLWCLIMLKLEI